MHGRGGIYRRGTIHKGRMHGVPGRGLCMVSVDVILNQQHRRAETTGGPTLDDVTQL